MAQQLCGCEPWILFVFLVNDENDEIFAAITDPELCQQEYLLRGSIYLNQNFQALSQKQAEETEAFFLLF